MGACHDDGRNHPYDGLVRDDALSSVTKPCLVTGLCCHGPWLVSFCVSISRSDD